MKYVSTILFLFSTLAGWFLFSVHVHGNDGFCNFTHSIRTKDDLEELYAIPREVGHTLLHQEKELQAWADELEKIKPQTPREVWTTFCVCRRAERNATVCEMLKLMKDMPQVDVERPQNYADTVLYFLPQKWETLKCFYEIFGAFQSPNYPLEISIVINGMQNTAWNQKQICQWLEERFLEALNLPLENRTLPFRADSLAPISYDAVRWLEFYLIQLQQAGSAVEVVTRFADDAKQNPDDLEKLAVFLMSFVQCREINLDIGWIFDNIDAYSTVEIWRIGQSLIQVDSTRETGEMFLKHALDKKLSDEDCLRFQAVLQMRTSMGLPQRENEVVQAIFHVEIMDDLNRLYLAQGRAAEAQEIMLAARGIRKNYSLPEGSLLAGMTQMSSGQRIVEAEIHAREETDAAKPAYWLERAAYYEGRKEFSEQENALKKALSLYNTQELRERDPVPGYRIVWSAVQTFFRKADRQEDECDLFFHLHDIVKDEPARLWELYYDFGTPFVKAGREEEFNSLLKEDIGKVVNRYVAKIKADDGVANVPATCPGLDLIRHSPTTAFSMGFFDFEANPHAWEIFKIQNSITNGEILRLALYTKDGKEKTPLNEKMLTVFQKALKQGKIPVDYYFEIGETIRKNAGERKNMEDYGKAITFFEEASRNYEKFSDGHPKHSIHTQLAFCHMELGDWRNGEKYTIRGFQDRGLQERELISWLGRAANIAEKSGEKTEAERIRRRITNLGSVN